MSYRLPPRQTTLEKIKKGSNTSSLPDYANFETTKPSMAPIPKPKMVSVRGSSINNFQKTVTVTRAWQRKSMSSLSSRKNILKVKDRTQIPAPDCIPPEVQKSIVTDKPPISFSYSFREINIQPFKTGIDALRGEAGADKHGESIVPWPNDVLPMRRDPCSFPKRQFNLKDPAADKLIVKSTTPAIKRLMGGLRKPVKSTVMEALYPGQDVTKIDNDSIRAPSVRNYIDSRREMNAHIKAGGKQGEPPVTPANKALVELNIIQPAKQYKDRPDWPKWFEKFTGQVKCIPAVTPIPSPVYTKIEFQNNLLYFKDSPKRLGALLKHKTAIETIRFKMPFDLRELEDVLPLDYLARYVILKPKKQNDYATVFQKFVDKLNTMGRLLLSMQYLDIEKLPEALNTVLCNNMKRPDWSLVNKNILSYSKASITENGVSLEQFCGICAFCERIVWSACLWKSDNLPRKPMIEELDFSNLAKRGEDFKLSLELITVMLSL